MRLRERIPRAAVLVCALACLCALPARALASSTEASILMDDKHLIYSSPQHVVNTLEQLKALGIDQVKVSVVWSLVVPKATSKKAPKFDAADPGAYPPGAWQRWDLLTTIGRQLGISVYLQITPPAPTWAVSQTRATQGYPWSHAPSASQYGKFVLAVARRYSGSYVPPEAQAARDEKSMRHLPMVLPDIARAASSSSPAALPRVSEWGIWNEPNEGAWLNPQWKKVRGVRGNVDTAPAMYRQLVDSAYSALNATGHGTDVILVGEIASRGWIYPVPFVQALYCVDSHNRPLRGRSATLIGCPSSGGRRAFAARHPGLFIAFAHHPYSFDTPPNKVMTPPSLITLANLGVLQRALNRIYAVYGRHPRGGVPMYLTEWGYKTNPPNPFVKTSLGEQATWLNEGEYMTWKDRSVRALNQFLLTDSPPVAGKRKGSRQYWGTFQTGLLFANGTQKPSYDAFRIPIWLPSSNHRHATIWGELRPADHSKPQLAALQFQRRGSTNWSTLRQIQTSNREGFLLAHLSLPSAGNVRLAWTNPANGAVYYSRTVGVS
jgi:hypothetical protein